MSEEAIRRPTATDALKAVGRDFRLGGILLMGIGPGLSITVSGGTLSFWLAENGFSPSQIGFLALAMLPFVLKFVWAPLIEGSFAPLSRLLGFRKSWLIPLNLLTVGSILLLSQVDPKAGELGKVAAAALFFSLCAASQEVVLEGLRIDRTRGPAMPIGTTLMGIGARFGMLIGSAGPLIIAQRFGWETALIAVAMLMLLVSVGAMILGDARDVEGGASSLNLRARLIDPFREFFGRDGALLVFGFMLFVRLGDTMAGSMFPPFAIAAKFTKDQIAFANSVVGFFAVILGSLAGVLIYRKTSERLGLLLAIVLVSVSNFGYVFLAAFPGDAAVLAIAMGLENFAGGIGAVMMLSFMSRLSDARFTATQFALMVAIGSVMRFVIPGPSGKLVEMVGYQSFFIITIFASLPALLILWRMMQRNLVSADRPSPRRANAPAFE
jgi:MFS transporter, PAT family, beta-lactamase induction signal transducer AmpG